MGLRVCRSHGSTWSSADLAGNLGKEHEESGCLPASARTVKDTLPQEKGETRQWPYHNF